MTLTFEENKFVIRGVPMYAPPPFSWRKVKDGEFYTKDIKSAARFKSDADSKAKRIFDRFMLKDFAIPSGGPICPSHLSFLPFQRERGIPHLLQTSKTYLAHQPGLGKSAQFIGLVNTKPGPALIVCPSFAKTTWAREITKWFVNDFPEIEIVPETEKRFETNWSADFVICSDAMILKEWVRAGILKTKFRHVALDEGHRFKEPTSLRTMAVFGGRSKAKKFGGQKYDFSSPGLIYDAEHVVVLSGTPLLNRPIELWPMLFAMAPELIDFMPYADFGFRYCGPRQDEYNRWQFLGSSNEDELNKRIMGRFMQRLKKVDVLPDLPKKIREVIPLAEDLRPKDVIQFDKQMLKNFSGDYVKPSQLKDYAVIRHATGLAKVKPAAKFVNDILANDVTEQIVLFAWHRDVVAALAKELNRFNPMVINGGVSETDRTKFEDLFQSGKHRLIIGNIAAMNLAITLTAATRIVFCEYDWTPALNEQAEDRGNRIGSKWSLFCQYLVLTDSMDEQILTSNVIKEERNERVLR